MLNEGSYSTLSHRVSILLPRLNKRIFMSNPADEMEIIVVDPSYGCVYPFRVKTVLCTYWDYPKSRQFEYT